MTKLTAGVIVVLVLLAPVASAEPPADPKAAARRWLAAVRDGDVEAFAASVKLPFRYRELWPNRQCRGKARTTAEAVQILKCIREKEPLLAADLEWVDETLTLEVGLGRATDSLWRAATSLGRRSGHWVHGVLPGDGLSFGFLFKLAGVGGRTVSAVVVQVEFDGS
jgi:hypothetical protein